MTAPHSANARDIARRLLTEEFAGSDDPTAIGVAMQRVYTRVSGNLRRSVGEDGYNALISRALAQVQPDHPVLSDLRRANDGGIHLDSVAETVGAHGAPAVSAALESLLATLVDVLSGLIGADMVINLVDQDSTSPQTATAGPPQ
ncbi:MAG: hypothetical protein H0U59_01415 [Gemmatimonadaceae bacterium]|nr:hypothetical protein [Gemmatimonadaceae bacterium]